MKLFLTNERGRSMIEMLGVLAIVGILSVGGIAGYSKAMRKYKYMKLADEMNLFIISSQPYLKDLFRAYNNNTGYSPVPAQILKDLHFLPSTWAKIQDHSVYDSVGQRINFFFRATHPQHPFAIDYLFIDQQHKGQKILSMDEITRCQYIWQYVVIPNANILYRAGVTNSPTYFGSNYCDSNNLCITNMSPQDIYNVCVSCAAENVCVLAIDILP